MAAEETVGVVEVTAEGVVEVTAEEAEVEAMAAVTD